MILTIIAFVLILSVLVLVHELGHFITAKKFGVKVEEFGFGFPPRVFGFKKGETIYSINLLPFGGFVKMFGEDAAGGGKIRGKGERESGKGDIKRAFFARPAWQKAIIVFAGVVMNFVLAVVLISYLFAAQGVALPTKNVKIVEVVKNTPAAQVGLIVGDVVTNVNGKKITDTKEFADLTRKYLGDKITIDVKRGDRLISLVVTPRKEYPKGEGPLGVAISSTEIKKYAWYEAPFFGTWEAIKFSLLILTGLFDMVVNLVLHGARPAGVAGPIGVAQLTGQAVSYGLNATLWFMALLSLNLAVLNVLPIPALDGGRLFFILIELITRKKVNAKYETLAHAVGLVLLLSLIVVITFFDVLRLLSGKSILQP